MFGERQENFVDNFGHQLITQFYGFLSAEFFDKHFFKVLRFHWILEMESHKNLSK